MAQEPAAAAVLAALQQLQLHHQPSRQHNTLQELGLQEHKPLVLLRQHHLQSHLPQDFQVVVVQEDSQDTQVVGV